MSLGHALAAFVLHTRPYKETSALVDLFTREGRVRAVFKGGRGRSGLQARPFVPLEVELYGRSELKNVRRLEISGQAHWLEGDVLFSALYLNELLMRLLPEGDPQPEVFQHYQLTLQGLAEQRPLQPLLRAFEWRLLEQLGYGFSLTEDRTDAMIVSEGWYRLLPDSGFERISEMRPGAFSGGDIQAMARVDWSDPRALAAAKRLMRQALAPHLGGRPLVSRELFMTVKESTGV